MSQAQKQALALRDLAVQVATAKGVKGRDLFSYADPRLGINYYTASPYTIDVWKISETETKVLSVIWKDGGDAVVVIHRGGSWEINLKRLAGNC
jgi:hypothetical protein